MIGLIGLGAMGGGYVSRLMDQNFDLLGYGAMSVLVIFIIYEYLVTATGVQVTSNSILVVYPFTKRNIPF